MKRPDFLVHFASMSKVILVPTWQFREVVASFYSGRIGLTGNKLSNQCQITTTLGLRIEVLITGSA